jgi:hypothetical protein
MAAAELGLEPHDILMLEGHPSHCFIWGRENNIHQLKRFCASENTHKEPCVFCPRVDVCQHGDILDTYSFSCEYISFLRSFLCEQSFKASWPSSPHNHTYAIQLLFYLHFIMRVIQLVITIALLSYKESSGVAALSSPLRGAERRAKAGKTKKKSDGGEATVCNPL